MDVVAAVLLGYLIGAIPFAVIVARSHGIDIFSVGSGNAGFTNAYRTLGFRSAFLVLVCDILKGTLAAFLGFRLGGEIGMLLASAAAIFGHTYSLFIGFRGGKGVATGAGVMLFVSPPVFLICAVTLATLAYVTGYMSVGSLTAAILCPILLVLFDASPLVVTVFGVCCLYVIWKHRTNIRRLMDGTENKIRNKRS